MEVRLTPEQGAFVQMAERLRAETIMALDEAESDLGIGLYRDYSESSLPRLVRELKSEGRAFRRAKAPSGT